MAKRQRRGRGPGKKPAKQAINIRLEVEVLEAYKATGPGWQGRMRDAIEAAAVKLSGGRVPAGLRLALERGRAAVR
jgi:uncharacterized protein (DUF4415 family)